MDVQNEILDYLGSEATIEVLHEEFDGKSEKQCLKALNEMFPSEDNEELAKKIHDYISTHAAASTLGSMTSEAKAKASRENGKKGGRPKMSKLLRIQIRETSGSDTYRAVKIYRDAEVVIQRDYGTIGEAARDNFDKGVKIFVGKHEITQVRSESGEIG